MASRKIEDLEYSLRPKVRAMIRELNKEGVDLLVYCTYRSPEEQAILYRKSRSWEQIDLKARKLDDRGFGSLSNILIGVGPQDGEPGRHLTFAGPGESWHQYRQAFDGVPMVMGKCAWNAIAYKEQWEKYGRAAEKHGFFWAGHWKRFKEYPHCQAMPGGNPLKVLDLQMVAKATHGLGSTGLFR